MTTNRKGLPSFFSIIFNAEWDTSTPVLKLWSSHRPKLLVKEIFEESQTNLLSKDKANQTLVKTNRLEAPTGILSTIT